MSCKPTYKGVRYNSLEEIKNQIKKDNLINKDIRVDELPDQMTVGDIADLLAYQKANNHIGKLITEDLPFQLRRKGNIFDSDESVTFESANPEQQAVEENMSEPASKFLHILKAQVSKAYKQKNKIHNRLTNLRNSKANQEEILEENKRLSEINQRIYFLNSNIDQVTSNGFNGETLKNLYNEQRETLNKVKELQQEASIEELYDAYNIVNIWKDARDNIFGEELEIASDVLESLKTIREDVTDNYEKQIYLLIPKKIASLSAEESYKELTEEEINKPLKEINYLQKMFLSAGNTGVALGGLADQMINTTDIKTKEELRMLMEEMDEKFNELENSGYSPEDILQRDKDGELTYQLIWDYTYEFERDLNKEIERHRGRLYNIRKEHQEKRKEPDKDFYKKITDEWANHFDWKAKNMRLIDIRYFLNDNDILSFKGKNTQLNKNKFFNKKDEYVQELYDELGKELTDELILKAKDKYNRFIEQQNTYEEHLKDLVESGEITKKEKEKRSNIFRHENSPYAYAGTMQTFVNRKKNGNKYKPQKLDSKYAYQYVVEVPRKVSLKGNNTGYYDKNFESVRNTPELKEFYDYYSTVMQNLLGYLPENVTREIQPNFLAKVKKSFTEQGIKGREFKSALLNKNEDIIRNLTAEGGFDSNPEMYDENGERIQIPPINYIHDLRKTLQKNITHLEDQKFLEEHEKLELERLKKDYKRIKHIYTTDLKKALEDFSAMAVGYKYKSEVESTINMITELVRTSVGEVTDNAGNPVQNISGDILKKAKAAQDIYEHLKFTQDNALYGEGKKKTASNINLKKREDHVKFKNRKKELEQQYEHGTISEKEFEEKLTKLHEESKAAGRSVVLSQIGDKVLKVTQLLGIGWNIPAMAANVFFGYQSLAVWAGNHNDFTIGTLRKAFLEQMKQIQFIFNKKDSKMYNLMQKGDFLKEYIEEQSEKSRSKKRNRLQFLNPYEGLAKGDFLIRSLTMVAVMMEKKTDSKGNKLIDKEGNEVSVWEAYNDKGEWDIDKMGENYDWSGDIATQKKEFYKLANYIEELSEKLHGNFNPSRRQMYKKYWLGRALGQFRGSWMAVGVEQRFGSTRYDHSLGREVTGRYRSYVDYAKSAGFIKGIINPILRSLWIISEEKMFNNFTNAEKEKLKNNLRMNIYEIRTYAIMFSALALIKAMIPDDDEDEIRKRSLFASINILRRVMGDTTMYVSPSMFRMITRGEIAPVIGTITDFGRATSSIYQYIMGDESYDAEHAWYNTRTVIPFLNNYNKLKYTSQQELNY